MYTDTDTISEVPRRHLLVFINPVCGQGKAEQEFREHVQPLFNCAEISYDVVVTGEVRNQAVSKNLGSQNCGTHRNYFWLEHCNQSL